MGAVQNIVNRGHLVHKGGTHQPVFPFPPLKEAKKRVGVGYATGRYENRVSPLFAYSRYIPYGIRKLFFTHESLIIQPYYAESTVNTKATIMNMG